MGHNSNSAVASVNGMPNPNGFMDHFLGPPIHSTPLPPFSTFMQKRPDMFNNPSSVFQYQNETGNAWAPHSVSDTWMEPWRPQEMFMSPDFEAPNVNQRSAFRAVTRNNLYRPQPVKMLPAPSDAHRSLHMNHMMCRHDNMNNTRSVFDAGTTTQLDVAITLAHMGDQ